MARIDIIGEIDAEIARLQQARALLSESGSGEAKRRPGRPIGSGAAKNKLTALPAIAKAQPRRKISAAGRARISAAMKARWAKVRRVAKKAAGVAAKAVPVAAKPGAQRKRQRRQPARKFQPRRLPSPRPLRPLHRIPKLRCSGSLAFVRWCCQAKPFARMWRFGTVRPYAPVLLPHPR